MIAAELGCLMSKLKPYFPNVYKGVVGKYRSCGGCPGGIIDADPRFCPYIVVHGPWRQLDLSVRREAAHDGSKVSIPKQRSSGTWRH